MQCVSGVWGSPGVGRSLRASPLAPEPGREAPHSLQDCALWRLEWENVYGDVGAVQEAAAEKAGGWKKLFAARAAALKEAEPWHKPSTFEIQASGGTAWIEICSMPYFFCIAPSPRLLSRLAGPHPEAAVHHLAGHACMMAAHQRLKPWSPLILLQWTC
jgi:hypothetical protein